MFDEPVDEVDHARQDLLDLVRDVVDDLEDLGKRRDDEPRVAAGFLGYRQSEVHYYDADSKSWHKIHSEKDTGTTMEPWVMHGDGKRFYAVMPEKTGPSSLYLVDANGNRELVIRDEVSDPTRPVMSLDGKDVIGVEFSSTMPKRHWLLPDHPDAILLKNLQRSFAGQWVSFSNATDNGQQVVFTVRSDRNAGDFYLYDRDDRKATYLASSCLLYTSPSPRD